MTSVDFKYHFVSADCSVVPDTLMFALRYSTLLHKMCIFSTYLPFS